MTIVRPVGFESVEERGETRAARDVLLAGDRLVAELADDDEAIPLGEALDRVPLPLLQVSVVADIGS